MTSAATPGGATPTNVAALVAQELAALAADAQTLGALLAPGDVVKAVVLPSNGLTDLLEIGGLRVAAELPPTLLPGETITVMVTGSSGDRIHLHIIPAYDGSAPEPLPRAVRGSAAGAAFRLLPRTAGPAPKSTAAAAPTADKTAGSISAKSGSARSASAALLPTPPVVAPAPKTAAAPATAQSAAPKPVPVIKDAGRPGVPSPNGARALVLGHGVAASSNGQPGRYGSSPFGLTPAVQRTQRPPASLKSIEARLAAAHATTPPSAGPLPAGSGRPVAPLGQGAVPRPPPGTASTMARPIIGVRLPSPPLIASSIQGGPRELLGRSMEPSALLRALNLPVTATNVAAARIALETPDKLPNALATLERALGDRSDPDLATLSTLTSFLARLELKSPVFETQIAAFVDHIVTGREAKLAALASVPSTGQRAEMDTGAERVALIRTSLDYDFKSQLLAFCGARAGASDAAEPRAAALDHAVSGALTAITALQLNASATLAAHPDGLTFTLPLMLADGPARARIRIDRDVPAGRGVRLDGDNFHIAFVLETRNLGTVAVEMATVGRAVTLSVKTEDAPAQRIFGRAIAELTARLESLRYTVAKAEAVVAPASATVEPAGPSNDEPKRLVDTDA